MIFLRIALVLGLFLCWGCTSLVQNPEYQPNPQVLADALSGRDVLGQDYRDDELPNDDLFSLTPEMARFAEQAVANANNTDKKTEALHTALLSQYGRGINYSAYTTITGAQAFEQRQANCLSYTLLFVTMARHVGINAQFNEVMLPPTWDMRPDNTYLFMHHVNAKVVMHPFNLGWVKVIGMADVSDIVIDLEMRRYKPHYEQHIIDEDQIAAQYYSNRGMELANAGDTRAAFLNLRKALILDKKASYIWNNLGSFYRRLGYLPMAEAVYLHGWELNAKDPSIMHNLAGLYKDLGNDERSAFFLEKVKRHREANPYYQYQLARDLISEKQDYQQAREHIERSLKAEKNEPRFYQLAAEIYEHLGEKKLAEKMRVKAQESAAADGE